MGKMGKLVEFTIISVGFVLLLGAVGGWVFNIVRIVQVIDLPITGMFILRCVGVLFAPLGAILGFM